MFVLAEKSTKELHEEGAWFHIADPSTGLPAYADKEETKPCRIKLQGMESAAGRKLGVKGRNKLMKEAARKGRKEITESDIVDGEIEDAEFLASLALDWENIYNSKGKAIDFSKEEIKNSFIRQSWLRKQCLDFVADEKSFFTSKDED